MGGCVQVPCRLPPVNCAETKVGPVGSTSFSTTFCAVAGPLLVIRIVYVTFEPAATGSGLSVLVIAISALELIVVCCGALLLAVLGAVVAFESNTVAVLEKLPLLPAGTASVM